MNDLIPFLIIVEFIRYFEKVPPKILYRKGEKENQFVKQKLLADAGARPRSNGPVRVQKHADASGELERRRNRGVRAEPGKSAQNRLHAEGQKRSAEYKIQQEITSPLISPRFLIAATAGTSLVEKSKQIIGGSKADPTQFPWQVYITIDNSWLCGGSVIAPDWVLTAAHCVKECVEFNLWTKIVL
jgi:hypothetical protein